ncbi:DUF4065 domain-containing protein [Dyadobacter flavalbus]|uniref:DUF4065 domain-containing protein n=1 Tax=Dyadobacter flavalbus TaxID=2579942 RepID=A0A5M8QYZ1_9BACT|nr:Panacea domain-containing protein [Dyadobacter flavalbus]KAA6440270.1 DUF4065 domain-containing protein [Dyadobacter flavalbus]
MIAANKTNSVTEKTRELLIYIANQLQDKPNYGATLLNKAFYFIDSVSYLKRREPISSFLYEKQKNGPTPKPSQLLSLRDELCENGDITIVEKERFGFIQKKLIAKRPSNNELFSKDEIILIDEVLKNICDISATDISDFSHQFMAWKYARDREELPLFTYLLTYKTASENDRNWANSKLNQRVTMSNY